MFLAWFACAPEPGTPPDPAILCDESGVVCTWLGVPGFAGQGEDGLDRLETLLYLPVGVAVDEAGAWVADYTNHRIRAVAEDGAVTTVAGTGFLGAEPPDCSAGCDAATYPVRSPLAVARDPDDPSSLWVASDRVLRVDLDAGLVYWPLPADAGPAEPGHLVSHGGALYASDPGQQVVWRVDPATGAAEVLAGTLGEVGYDEHHLHPARLYESDPVSLPLAVLGDLLLIGDTANGVIRAVDLAACTSVPCPLSPFAGAYTSLGTITAYEPLSGDPYQVDLGSIPGYAGDGGDADAAVFAGIHGLAVGPGGEVYVVDTDNHCVRVILPDHTIETFAGECTAPGFSGDHRPATAASFQAPEGVAVGPDGAVYVADTMNQVIRRVAP